MGSKGEILGSVGGLSWSLSPPDRGFPLIGNFGDDNDGYHSRSTGTELGTSHASSHLVFSTLP